MQKSSATSLATLSSQNFNTSSSSVVGSPPPLIFPNSSVILAQQHHQPAQPLVTSTPQLPQPQLPTLSTLPAPFTASFANQKPLIGGNSNIITSTINSFPNSNSNNSDNSDVGNCHQSSVPLSPISHLRLSALTTQTTSPAPSLAPALSSLPLPPQNLPSMVNFGNQFATVTPSLQNNDNMTDNIYNNESSVNNHSNNQQRLQQSQPHTSTSSTNNPKYHQPTTILPIEPTRTTATTSTDSAKLELRYH